MRQEFVYSQGKVFVENNVLYIRNYLPNYSKSMLGRSFLAVGWLLMFCLNFTESNDAERYTKFVILGLLVVLGLPDLYDAFIRRSYANRIPMKRIVSYEVRNDYHGLETFVLLKLKSGRIREIAFRNLEHQAEPFTAFLSQHVAQIQLA